MKDQDQNLIKISGGMLGALSRPGGLGINVFAREILLLQCIVAGTSFRKFKPKQVESLALRQKLELRREPQNKHDEFAIAVYYGKLHTGYLPRDKNEVIARLLDAGKDIYALLTEKEWEGNWLRLEVDVFLKD